MTSGVVIGTPLLQGRGTSGSWYCVAGGDSARRGITRAGGGRGGGDAQFEHAFQAMDVEHVGGERDGADLGDARRAVATHEAEQRVDAPQRVHGSGLSSSAAA